MVSTSSVAMLNSRFFQMQQEVQAALFEFNLVMGAKLMHNAIIVVVMIAKIVKIKFLRIIIPRRPDALDFP